MVYRKDQFYPQKAVQFMLRKVADVLLPLDRAAASGDSLTRQIYAQLRAAILDGRLRADDRLPPTRVLAQQLGVARLTVATAYEWLTAEGYVYGRVGAGTFVSSAFGDQPATLRPAPIDQLQREAHVVQPKETRDEPTAAPSRHLSAWAQRIATIPIPLRDTPQPDGAYDFRPTVGAADAFPWARWRRLLAAQDPLEGERTQTPRARASSPRWDDLLGPVETRRAIAAWLRRSRAVRCTPQQVLIASSVQQMLALLARLLIEPGQRLLVEDPGYSGFHAAFLAEGAVLEGVPVDENGIAVAALPGLPRNVRGTALASGDTADTTRILVVTPSHQYPTGVTLTMERRLALLNWSRQTGALLVEDDYDGDLRLDGQPLEALRGLDERDEVIYLGTFAKALFPALHLGYAVLPEWLIEPVARARATSDRHPRWHDALAVAQFIEEGELERHLARVRRLYRARRDALRSALAETLSDVITVGPAEAGIHLLVALPPYVDDIALAARAEAQHIAVAPLSPHTIQSHRRGLLIGFGAMSEERIPQGVEALAPLVRAAACCKA